MGTVQELCSTNPVTIALWLYEQAQKNTSENAALGPFQMEVWPLYDSTGRKDWKPGYQIIDMDDKQTKELVERLYQVLWPKKDPYEPPEDVYKTLREIRKAQEEMMKRDAEEHT